MIQSKMKPAPLIQYPFPIREGQMAYLVLPVNLTLEEVINISEHMETLIYDREETQASV